MPEEPAAPAAEAAGPEVDLLHAAPARVSVSSVYRGNAEQVARMLDGDLETAWNSQTGDLVGAWIEVEVPESATVRAIALTPGFVRRTDAADLFTGNHRVARVRVEAVEAGAAQTLGESSLDVDTRDLVEVPVGRAGGRFRLHVLETRAGTREDWREICVSELRVLGTMAGATAGARTPTTSVGHLDTAEPNDDEAAEIAAEEAEDAAADAEMAALDRELAWDGTEALVDSWSFYADSVIPSSNSGRVSDRQRERRRELRARREAAFVEAAELVAEADPAQAASLRARGQAGYDAWDDLQQDLDAIVAAGETVLAPIPEYACRWAGLRSLSRLRLYASVVDGTIFRIEGLLEFGEDVDGFPLRADGRAELRAELTEERTLNRAISRLNADDLDTVSAALRRQLLAMDAPTATAWVSGLWNALRTELERAQVACAR